MEHTLLSNQVILLFIFIFGTIIGSFLNVVIVRIPKGENIIYKTSHCTNCKKSIKWYHNIPLLSYILLRGRCYYCKFKISIIYPLTELITGIAAILVVSANYQGMFVYVVMFSVFCVFWCHMIIDIRHRILPDELNLYLGVIFLLNAIIFMHWKDSLIGAIVGFSIPYLIAKIFYIIKGQIGMGGGDIKLYGVLGIYLGPLGVIQNIFFSSFLGSIVCLALIVLKKMNKKDAIPFGPFIIIIAAFQILLPQWYANFISIIF